MCKTVEVLVPGLPFDGRDNRIPIHHDTTRAERQVPSQRAPLSRRKILYGMEREGREIRDFPSHSPLPLRAERMRTVRADDDSSDRLLERIGRTEQMLLRFNDRENLVVVAHDTAEVDRHDNLCPLGDGLCEFVIVHLDIVLLRVNEHELAADMLRHRRRSGVGICRNDHLVFGADTDQPQRQLHGSRRGIQTDDLVGMAICSDFFFKLLRSRSGRDPTGKNRFPDFACLGFRHVGGGEGDFASLHKN